MASSPAAGPAPTPPRPARQPPAARRGLSPPARLPVRVPPRQAPSPARRRAWSSSPRAEPPTLWCRARPAGPWLPPAVRVQQTRHLPSPCPSAEALPAPVRWMRARHGRAQLPAALCLRPGARVRHGCESRTGRRLPALMSPGALIPRCPPTRSGLPERPTPSPRLPRRQQRTRSRGQPRGHRSVPQTLKPAPGHLPRLSTHRVCRIRLTEEDARLRMPLGDSPRRASSLHEISSSDGGFSWRHAANDCV